ncbi:MAG: D-2-hydroxyacid dehydrogenase [Luteitalea sp.]|nr:D-2-hydroxyacid dehydrogenase [Luteitalea sp.]
MNVAVGVVSPNAAWVLPRRFVDQLRSEFPQHLFVDAWDREALRRVLVDADAAFAAFVDADLVPSLTALRWVQAPAVGVGHILSPELVASPIVLTSARGVRARAIAEHVLGLTLALARQIHTAIRHQVRHEWALDEIEASGAIKTLQGGRMGIVGLGAIGAEVAGIARAFGMRVSGIRKRFDQPPPRGVDEVLPPERLPDLLATCDVVVLSAPLTRETLHLIGDDALRFVKPGALLINIGRGQLVDDAAVIRALRDGRLGGAALDVFTHEPLDPSSPYWDLPNVIVTPHSSGAMEDYWSPLVRLFADNLRRFEAGEPLVNVVDKAAGY